MIDKEAQEKTAIKIQKHYGLPFITSDCERTAKGILHLIYKLGYRKLPKDKPPLLSEEEFDNWYRWFVELFNRNQLDSEKNAIKHLLQARREADIKHYENPELSK